MQIELKKLTNGIEDIGRHYGRSQAFDWFLEDLLKRIGLLDSVDVPEDVRDEFPALAEEYSHLVREHRFVDILGPLYMELGHRGDRKYFGQFFTPWEIAQFMAEINLAGAAEKPRGEHLIRVLEPTCGSGVMLLAVMDKIARDYGPEDLRNWSFTGVDLDLTCARMTAIQIMANLAHHDLVLGEVRISQANSLSLEHLRTVVWATAAPLVAEEDQQEATGTDG